MRYLRSTMLHRHAFVVATLLMGSAIHLWAQATFPTPILTSISPMGGQPGSRVEITFKGSDLDGAKSLLLGSLRHGISRDLPISAVAGKKGVLSVELPADIPSDLYDARLVGRFGVSNPRVFQVSDFKAVESPGTNSKADTALKVDLNSAIQGVFKGGVPHWFTFDAKKGQRVLALFVGADFDSKTYMVGELMDSSGREIGRMREGFLDFTVPEDGNFRLSVNDLMYGVGDDFGYRLSLTTEAVVWAAARNTLYGWNLPSGKTLPNLRVNQGKPLERLETDAATVTQLIASSSLMTYVFADEFASLESPLAPTPIKLGQSVSGWFPASGSACVYDLAFNAGDRFTIEVISQQIGLPTDPSMVVESVKRDVAGVETVAIQADLNDPPASVPIPSVRLTRLDPVYAYDAKADGLFRLSISDPLNAANGWRYPFQLRVTKAGEAQLDHAIAMHPTLPKAAAVGPYEMASANVWRQGMTALEVLVPGRSALSEPLELMVGQLPPGVTCLGGFIGGGQSVGYIGFRASADAATGASILSGLNHTAFLNWYVKDSNRESMFTRMAAAPALGVVDQDAPALIEATVQGIQDVGANGKVDISFKVTRHRDFTEALKLKVLGLVDVAKAPELSIAAKATEGKLTLDTKALKLAPGDYGFILQGPAKMPFRREASALVEAELASQKAAAAQATAKKALAEANAALKAIKPEDKTALAAHQTKVKEATAKMAQTDKAKLDTAKAAKEMAAKNPAKSATFIVYSNPVRIRVKEPAKK